MVARQRLVVASHPGERLAEVVERVGQVLRDIRLFPNLERALEVRLRFGELALGEIDVADVVEHERHAGGIAGVAPQLQRFAHERQRVIRPARASR